MIEKLPDIKVSEATTPAVQYTMFIKIQELIDKVNALEKAVKQCDRPVDLDI